MSKTFEIDLHFQPMTIQTPESILNMLYAETSAAIDQHNLIDGYCYIFIPVSKRSKVFAQVTIDAVTNDVQYFVKRNPKTGDFLPALSYTNAVRELRQLLT